MSVSAVARPQKRCGVERTTSSALLAGMQEQEDHPTLKRVLGELRTAVEGGEGFSAALAKHPKCFDRMFVALVPPAEAVTHLDEFLAVRRDAASFRWAAPAACPA